MPSKPPVITVSSGILYFMKISGREKNKSAHASWETFGLIAPNTMLPILILATDLGRNPENTEIKELCQYFVAGKGSEHLCQA